MSISNQVSYKTAREKQKKTNCKSFTFYSLQDCTFLQTIALNYQADKKSLSYRNFFLTS